MTNFALLGLNKTLQANLKQLGYKQPTEIQQKSIGAVLSGADTYAIAPTGTGKTAAFLLPILQELSQEDHSNDEIRPIRALFLVPTRDLAQQLEQSIANYGRNLNLRTITLMGGVRISSQSKRFKRGADIIVSTPKRLVDLVKLKTFSLQTIRHFVMDEADRLVSMGIMPILSYILTELPAKKQMVLFSATDSKALAKFSQMHLNNVKSVKTEKNQPAQDKIFHTMYRCPLKHKDHCLSTLLETIKCDRALIFARTKHDVNRLSILLNGQGFSSEGLHNEVPQRKRQQRLEGFKNRKFKFLIATDVASRGIDIDDLYYVINYDLPVNSNDYIHRVGRTARTTAMENLAKQNAKSVRSLGIAYPKKIKGDEVLGHAFSLVSPEQERLVVKIQQAVGKEIKLERNPFSFR